MLSFSIQKVDNKTLGHVHKRESARLPICPKNHNYVGLRAVTVSNSPQIPKLPKVGCAHRKTDRGRRKRLHVSALFEKFTERSIKAVMLAQEWAKGLGSAEVAPVHVLMGLVSEGGGHPGGLLDSGITPEGIRKAIAAQQFSFKQDLVNGQNGEKMDVPFSQGGKRLFEGAALESRRMGTTYIAPEHILLAVLTCQDDDAQVLLQYLGADMDGLRVQALRRLKGEEELMFPLKKSHPSSAPPSAPSADKPASSSQALDSFCRDLCAEAAADKIDPVIGRSKEIQRVAQILSRRTKNNPILIGDPGVGKTAIAQGLARAIVSRSLPDGTPLPIFLRHKRLLSLDVPALIAGAKERGEMESRMTRLLSECKEAGNVILFIDEVHTLIGTGAVGKGGGGGGGGSGGLDLANLFKPALARGQVQCIGATTVSEHTKHIKRDAALERRFQPVMIDEPDEEVALAIINGLVDRYERHHRCMYAPEALEAAVKLSSRYIADRFLPDKAIDLLDEAGSLVRASTKRETGDARGNATASYAELVQVMEAKDEASRDALYEEATLLRAREMELKTRLSGMPEEGPVVPVVTVDHVKSIVAAWSGVPLERMGEGVLDGVEKVYEDVCKRIVGQEVAVKAATGAVARAAAGLKAPGRPIATLMFSGPTGVGKTELAKALCQSYFGETSSSRHSPLIRLDMSEYAERHSVARLIGAPPGYVGYGDGGKLTESVRRRPFSLILFDEIEKAHPDVFNILLQIIEDGRLTDSRGRVVSFKHSLIVLTTNVGSSVIAKGGAGVGFELPDVDSDGDGDTDKVVKPGAQHHARLRSLVVEELKSYFRPELLNRLDDIVVFRRLDKEDALTIVRQQLEETCLRAQEQAGITLTVEPDVLELIVEQGFSETWGARELRRAVVRVVDDVVSEAILNKRLTPGPAVLVCSEKGIVEVVAKQSLMSRQGMVVTSAAGR